MNRHYDLPALLVEFSPNRSFSLQAESEISSDIQVRYIWGAEQCTGFVSTNALSMVGCSSVTYAPRLHY